MCPCGGVRILPGSYWYSVKNGRWKSDKRCGHALEDDGRGNVITWIRPTDNRSGGGQRKKRILGKVAGEIYKG